MDKSQVKEQILKDLPQVKDFISYIKELYKDYLVAVVATGSRTKNEYAQDSDIDLDVVIDEFGEEDYALRDLESRLHNFPKIVPWVKRHAQFENPAQYLKTSTPFDVFELDGYSDLCKHIFWTDIKNNSVVLWPENSDLLDKMPSCPSIPDYEGYELYTVATRDLLKGIVEENDRVLAKAILRAASAEQLLVTKKLTNYADAAKFFKESINDKKNQYKKYISDVPRKPLRERKGFRKSTLMSFEKERELSEYVRLVEEALQVKLGKKEKLSFNNTDIMKFFDFVKHRTIAPSSRCENWKDNVFRGTTYFSRTSPKIVELLHKGFTNNKFGPYFLMDYLNEINLILMTNFQQKSILSKLDYLKISWEIIKDVDSRFTEEYNGTAGLLTSAIELSTYKLSRETVDKAKQLLQAIITARGKETKVLDLPKKKRRHEIKRSLSAYNQKVSNNSIDIAINIMSKNKGPTLDEKILLEDYDGALKDMDNLPKTGDGIYLIMNTYSKIGILLAQGKQKEAIYETETLLQKLPQNVQFLNMSAHSTLNLFIGNIIRSDDPESSLKYYDQAIKSDKNNELAYLSKANALAAMDRFSEALGTIVCAYDVNKGLSATGWQNMAAFSHKLNDINAEAFALFNLGLNYPDFLYEAFSNLSYHIKDYTNSNNIDYAKEPVSAAECLIKETNKTCPEITYALALYYTKLSTVSDNKKEYLLRAKENNCKAISFRPNEFEYWKLQGNIHQELGEIGESEKAYAIAESLEAKKKSLIDNVIKMTNGHSADRKSEDSEK